MTLRATRRVAWSALAALALTACAAAHNGDETPTEDIVYDVLVGPRGERLDVVATIAPSAARVLVVEDKAADFVRDVEIESASGWKPLPRRMREWPLPQVTAGAAPWRVRYRFLLADAARAIDDADVAMADGGAFLSPPSAWLLRPAFPDDVATFRARIVAHAGVEAICGLHRAHGADAYAGRVADLPSAPMAAFGELRRRTIRAPPHSEIELAVTGAVGAKRIEPFAARLDRAAGAVSAFFDGFPIDRVVVVAVASSSRVPGGGKTMGEGGASIVVGVDAGIASPKNDWLLTHELSHLAMPSLARAHHWLEEGGATYVEMLARAQAGLRTPEELWAELVDGLPDGLPAAGDRGLDRDRGWGRTYWGGALFCFAADLGIRRRTGGRASLRDAFTAVAKEGNISQTWSVERVLSVGDAATGGSELRDLYGRMALEPGAIELAPIWRELGVRMDGNRVVALDDSAPLAAIRRTFTTPRAHESAKATR